MEFKYFYNANGLIGYMTDGEAGIEYRYIYDEADRPGRVERSNGITSWYNYDDNLASATTTENFYESIGDSTYETEYNSDEDGRPASVIISANGGTDYKVTYSYDYLNRVNTKQYFTGAAEEYKEEYTFIAGGQGTNSATALISSVEYNDTDTLTYTYDDNGNIITISDGTDTIQYYYDALNQLTRENNPFLGANGKTIIYAYDSFGNIDEKNEYEFTAGTATPTTLLDTIDYTYDATWKDKLASYDGSSITYDTIGNPLTYDGWTYTWKWGRRLETAGNTGAGISTSFKYNDSGIRTYKQVTDGEDTTEYFYNLMGNKITYEERTGAGACELYYAYDSGGKLYGFYYDGASDDGFYYYQRNIQGDIIGIMDSNGDEKVTYVYDTWGKLESTTGTLASTIGADNPFRYRGYYYDNETGLYYLNARYYNPSWGRFINADSYGGATGDLLGHNIFAYCSNNPVMKSDPSGCFWYYGNTQQSNTTTFEEAKNFKASKKSYLTTLYKIISDRTKNNPDGTLSIGLLGSGGGGLYGSASLQLSFDFKGNVALQGSSNLLRGGGTPSITGAAHLSITNGKNVFSLNGDSYQGGGSYGKLGIEGGFFRDNETGEIRWIATGMYGVSPVPELHGEVVSTTTIWSVNASAAICCIIAAPFLPGE